MKLLPAGVSNLNGTITDSSTGEPIEDVTVTMKSIDSTFVGTAVTDENGNYSITDVNSGQVDITATKTGYSTSTSTKDLIEDINNTNNFKLTPSTSGE